MLKRAASNLCGPCKHLSAAHPTGTTVSTGISCNGYNVGTSRSLGLKEQYPIGICYSTSTDSREYLHRSTLPTDHFQRSLPRLPIPKLEKTCERYLTSQKPLLTPEDYAKTEAIVKNFLINEGQVLHQELVEIDKKNKHTNYISGPWFDMYLKDRRSVVLNHNAFLALTNDPRPEYNDQLIRATNLLVSSIRFMKTIRANILDPEVFHLNPAESDTESFRRRVRLLPKSISWYGAYFYKAFPLDMSQYGRLFNSTRIPRHQRDELFTDESAKHILVLKNGHYYVFNILDENGNIVPAEEILAHLKYILEDKQPPPEYPVGVLTADERDNWTNLRIQLVNAGNEETLRLIDSAAFVLALDNESPTDPNDISHLFLHGTGANRWFDKSFQLLITANGLASINMEHAWGDGVAVVRYIKEIFKDSTDRPCVGPSATPAQVDSSKVVQRLEFKLDPFLKQGIIKSKEYFDQRIGSLSVDHLEYSTFTKKFVKEQKISPDSVMQLAIQLAYYRLYGTTVGTYESCSTAAFKHGRTETVRSCTTATKAMCDKLFAGKQPPTVEELQQGIRQCSDMHNQLTKDAAMGQGFDRHLFALRTLAEQKGEVPEMFRDPAYKLINHIILSTSTLSDPSVVIGGFGPVQPDGFGIGYAIEDSRVGFSVSSYPVKNVRDFIACCGQSLDDIYSILQGKVPQRSS